MIVGGGSLSALSHTGSSSLLHSSPMSNTNSNVNKPFATSSPSMSSVSTSGTGTIDSPQNRQLNTGSINSNQSNSGIIIFNNNFIQKKTKNKKCF